MLSLYEKVEARIIPEPNSGCWLWVGPLTQDGYAHLTNKETTAIVHRITYERKFGKIPVGLQLDHLCRLRCCVNPDHLEPVTQAENVRRGARIRTHCKKGHPLDGRSKAGYRFCKECQKTSAREWARNKRPYPSMNLYCPHGHPLFGPNMYREKKKNGNYLRRCKTCRWPFYKPKVQR